MPCAAVDGKNNARNVGGDGFEVEIVGPGNVMPKAEIEDNNDGCVSILMVGIYTFLCPSAFAQLQQGQCFRLLLTKAGDHVMH